MRSVVLFESDARRSRKVRLYLLFLGAHESLFSEFRRADELFSRMEFRSWVDLGFARGVRKGLCFLLGPSAKKTSDPGFPGDEVRQGGYVLQMLKGIGILAKGTTIGSAGRDYYVHWLQQLILDLQ